MEKRDEGRAKKRIMVRYGTDKPTKSAFTKNLSASGLQIQTNNVIRPGTKLQLELKFPDRTFQLWGLVMWAKRVPPELAYTIPCGMGIAFIEPPPAWLTYFADWKNAGN